MRRAPTIIAILVMVVGLIAGCDRSQHVAARAPRTNTVEEATIQQGQRAEDGALIIHVFENYWPGLRFPVRVYDDYGFMVLNVGDEQHPKAEFKLAIKKESRVIVCSTMQEFQTALDVLPRGATLCRANKCGASSAWGLDEKICDSIESYCAGRGIAVTNAEFITCICPN